MDSPDYSSDNFGSSEEEIHGVKPMGRSMTLRDRQRRTYIEFGEENGDDSEEGEEEEEVPRKNPQIVENTKIQEEVDEQPFNEDPSGTNQDENFEEMTAGVFNPEIDQLLWRRDKFEDDTRKTEYLVKFKEYSYLHSEWMDESEILGIGKNAKNKLNRFNKTFEKKMQDIEEYDMATQEEKFFDPSFVEVDRIIYSTELFPVIHPKKANELKGKWSESLAHVVSVLLNFTKDNIHYGVYFMEPVDPDRDGVPNYRKIINNPMDLGTCLNRIYLDYYKSSQQFWNDLGFVFKNCRKFNKDAASDIRKLCDTLREVAIQLYQQWHTMMSDKYEKIKTEFTEKQKTQVNQPVPTPSEQDELQRQNELEFKSKENEIKNILDQFETFKSKTFMNPNSNPHQVQFQLNQFINSNPFIFPAKISMDEVSKTIENKASIEELNKLKNPSSMLPMPVTKSPSNPGAPADPTQKKPEVNAMPAAKFENTPTTSIQEVELWNPQEFSFSWVIDDKATIPVESEEQYYITAEDLQEVGLAFEVDKLYFVKWKNLSYIDATWERESIIEAPDKINDFRFFNRALDKESRQAMINQVNRHKTYMEILNNPKKKAKCSNAFINDLRNKLYCYDVSLHREPIQYTFKNQPIFKDQKMLRDYQLESLNWLIQAWYQRRNVILADEMGLGKTVQSISFLNHLNNFEGCRGPFLVIAPLSTLDHWKRTGENWTNLNSILYYDSNSIEGRSACRGYEWFYIDVSTKGSLLQTAELYKFQIMITSYEVFLQDLNQVFLQIPFQFIVVDEAHRLKNTNAKILTSLKRLACKRILLLTGTPIQNNTEELWSLLNYIEPDKFYSLQLFMSEFGDLSKMEQVEKLHKVLKPYLLRRRKEEVEQSIPPLQETIIDIEMTTIQKTIYRALYERNKSTLSKGMTNFATSLNNLEMQLRKCCNHPFLIKEIEAELCKDTVTYDDKFQKFVESSGKMILLDKLLPKMKGEGKKVLIFSQFTQMLALLEDYLRTRGYRYEKIDGAVKSKERQNAIDRFNDPSKKRDVFLLSTKAGGLGINLTSANVVVIYDSDWNPQNDVQATARAHRIGQQSEVMVYRLITSKTYESEMFERASKKLGLDQAIFMGGVFQSTKDEPKTRDKMNKQEVEALLKRGILGLFSDDNKESQTFMEQDIDEILSKNTRLAKCDILNGTYSFQKSTFVSEKTDKNLNVDDPNFWNIVLKNTESAPKQLLTELDSNKDIARNYDDQKRFMSKLSDLVYKVIENKLEVVGYNADDEKHVMDIINRISTSKQFHKNYREAALQWSYDIARPSRRVKKITVSDIEISKPSGVTKSSEAPRTRNAKKGDATGSDEEAIFNDEGEEQIGEEEFHNFDEEDEDGDVVNKKLSTKMKDEYLRKLCHYCERSKCTLYCRGFCKRNFHEICKDKLEQGSVAGLDKNVINFEIPETKMDEEKLKKAMNMDFLCTDCQKNVAICFKCKKKGRFYPELSSSKSKSKAKPVVTEKDESMASENGDDKTEAESTMSGKQEPQGKANDLIKCSTANCNKFYHLSCISDNPLFKFFDANKHKKFRCALHYCAKCKISGDTMAIAQCFRCPKAYHLKCYSKDKILKITKKVIICQDHEFETKNPAKEKEKEKEKDLSGSEKKKGNKDKNGTQLRLQKGEDNSMVIKMSKIDDKSEKDSNKDEEDYDDFKIPKNKSAKKKQEKLEKKKEEPEKRSDRSISISFKVGDEVVISDLLATVSGKLKRKLEMGEYVKPPKRNIDKEKLTYADLKIETPEEFDYENYDRDWCRYCGARYSSNFTKGPWGSRTLCTIHYIDWNQKKSLNLSSYKDLPKSPIKAEANTELNYLQKMLLKNDKELTPELLDSLRPSKKIRKGDTMEVIEDRKEPRSEGEIDPQEPMDEEKE